MLRLYKMYTNTIYDPIQQRQINFGKKFSIGVQSQIKYPFPQVDCCRTYAKVAKKLN
ncbi:hypothetical protein FIS3754_31530 [Fischerella sp. NIES-3754]|nr:hypothetical protein FIS3754_31530 [Fischerella sp. NIES-3754]BCX09550.1 MAG: hypothetical protein KatS3mg066_3409 [Fischerella sp.]